MILTLSLVGAVSAQQPSTMGLEFTAAEKKLRVDIDRKPFVTFNFSEKLPKPFLSPVRLADGRVLTRPLKDPEDHPHHKGVWISVDKVNGVDFWAEHGRIVNRSVAARHDGRFVTIRAVNVWTSLDGKPIVTEQTQMSIYPDRMIAFDIRFVAAHGDVTFGDTKEGLLGFRMVDSLREKETGKVINSAGMTGASACWGRPAAWVDYSGQVGGRPAGVALFDNASNPRPSRYHVRNYGLFSVSPFGERAYSKGLKKAAPLAVREGNILRFRYGLLLHSHASDSKKIEAAYQRYVQRTEDDEE